MRSNNRAVLLTVIVLALSLPLVFGATNILDSALKPLGTIDVASTYKTYAPFIDAIIYFIFFISIAGTALGDKFKDHKAVPIIMGVILAIGMTIFESTSKFNLGMLAPFAALIFFVTIGIGAYNWAKNLGGNTFAAVAIAFGVITLLIDWLAPTLVLWINSIPLLGTIYSLGKILAIFGIIYGFMMIWKGVRSGRAGLTRAERSERSRERDENRLLEKERKAGEKVVALNSDISALDDKLRQLEVLEDSLEGKDKLSRDEQLKLLQQLEKLIQGTWQIQKGIQKVHDNIAKPEYQRYVSTIEQYANMLNSYVSRIKQILANLETSIKNSKDETDQKLLNIDKEFKADIDRMLSENNLITRDIEGMLQNVKDTDIYPGLLAEYNTLNIESRNALQQDITVKDSEKTIIEQTQSIRSIDTEDLKDINRAFTLLDKDPLTTLTLTDVMKRTITFHLVRDQTLSEIEKIVKQVSGRTGSIIDPNSEHGLEASNDIMLKRKRERVASLLTTEKDLLSKYPIFMQKIRDEVLKLYSEEDKLFDEVAQKLVIIAQTLVVDDVNMDPGIKSAELNNASINLASTQVYINDKIVSKSKKSQSLKRDLMEYVNSLKTLTKKFVTKGKGKTIINKRNQDLLKEFINSLALAMKKRRDEIIQHAKK